MMSAPSSAIAFANREPGMATCRMEHDVPAAGPGSSKTGRAREAWRWKAEAAESLA